MHDIAPNAGACDRCGQQVAAIAGDAQDVNVLCVSCYDALKAFVEEPEE
jgi:formylmethanofuran dehydrogenase subunit E